MQGQSSGKGGAGAKNRPQSVHFNPQQAGQLNPQQAGQLNPQQAFANGVSSVDERESSLPRVSCLRVCTVWI